MCIAQVCRMTSESLDGQLQSCYTARARPKETFIVQQRNCTNCHAFRDVQ